MVSCVRLLPSLSSLQYDPHGEQWAVFSLGSSLHAHGTVLYQEMKKIYTGTFRVTAPFIMEYFFRN
jgi:hypothetical protein